MRHGAAKRAHEKNPPHTRRVRQPKDAFTEPPPVDIRLLAHKEDQPGGLVTVEDVRRHPQTLDQAVFDLDVGPEQGRHLHRPRKVVDVERFRVDLGERLGFQVMDQPLDRAGRDIATVHPAGKGQHQSRLVKHWTMADLEDFVWGLRHGSIVLRGRGCGLVRPPTRFCCGGDQPLAASHGWEPEDRGQGFGTRGGCLPWGRNVKCSVKKAE